MRAWLTLVLVAGCIPPATVHSTSTYAVPPERAFQAAKAAMQDEYRASACDTAQLSCVTRSFHRMTWIGNKRGERGDVRGGWMVRVVTAAAGSYVTVTPLAQRALGTWVDVTPEEAGISSWLDDGAGELADAIDEQLQALRR